MKALNVVAAFLGGMALGAAAGVLFAPEKVKILVIKSQNFCVKRVSV